MEEAGRLTAAGEWLGHQDLMRFDDVRLLLVRTGLSPEPSVYQLLWLHVGGADPALSRELERLIEADALTLEQVQILRQSHLGEVAAGELHELVGAAQATAEALAARLEVGLGDLRNHGQRLAEADEALGQARSSEELAELVQDLRRANAALMSSNRRLEADIKQAHLQNGRLLDRLDAAERIARTDQLTGLANRRGLMEALRRALRKHDGKVAIGLLDIDHFQRVNDQWGHMLGDEVLRCIAALLARHAARLGPDALAGRYGGDEFMLLLPGLSVHEAAATLDIARAQLARQLIRRTVDGASLGRVTFSAGVAERRSGDSAERLTDRADAALYAAKGSGRDRVLPEQWREQEA